MKYLSISTQGIVCVPKIWRQNIHSAWTNRSAAYQLDRTTFSVRNSCLWTGRSVCLDFSRNDCHKYSVCLRVYTFFGLGSDLQFGWPGDLSVGLIHYLKHKHQKVERKYIFNWHESAPEEIETSREYIYSKTQDTRTMTTHKLTLHAQY